MSKKDLQAEELIKLAEEEEIFNLESLITDGADARIPIEINFPTKEGTKKWKTIMLMNMSTMT